MLNENKSEERKMKHWNINIHNFTMTNIHMTFEQISGFIYPQMHIDMYTQHNHTHTHTHNKHKILLISFMLNSDRKMSVPCSNVLKHCVLVIQKSSLSLSTLHIFLDRDIQLIQNYYFLEFFKKIFSLIEKIVL